MEQTKVSAHFRMKIVAVILFALAVMTFGIGCASFERSNNSGYMYRSADNEQATVAADRVRYERESARSELGPVANERALDNRQALKHYERMLEGRSEREQYYKAKPHLRSDTERVQFLKLGSTGARDRYLNTKGINGDSVTHPPEVQALIDENDISAGMTREAVRASWGAPDNVDVAGNPIYGNEKWYYSEQVTSSEGYMTERRTVSFEGGRVVGWETR